MSVKVIDLSQELYEELSSPTDISMASISFWIRSNLGRLNNLLGTSFDINETNLEITPDMNINISSIFKGLYHIYNIERLARGSFGASSVVEIQSDGGIARLSSSTEKGKAYLQLRNQMKDALDDEISNYLNAGTEPLAVHGSDSLNTVYNLCYDVYNRSY